MPLPQRATGGRGSSYGGAACFRSWRSAHRFHHAPAHDRVVFDLLEHEFLKTEADQRYDDDAGHHRVGVEELARAEDEPAEAPWHGGEHFDGDQNAPGLRQPE